MPSGNRGVPPHPKGCKRGFAPILALLFGAAAAFAAPDRFGYHEIKGGVHDIPSGSIVEGSLDHGGIQPNYLIDFEAPEMTPLREFAQDLKKQNISVWEKIRRLNTFLQKFLPNGSYTDNRYVALLAQYRETGNHIPLSAYAACGVGVCRENALMTHLALKEAGIPNQFVYVQKQEIAYHVDGKVFDAATEDHAFSVVRIKGENWIVDSYNHNFNGLSYDQLSDPKLTRAAKLKVSPLAEKPDPRLFRRILRVNTYPTVWRPKSAPCPGAFESLIPR